jgi:glycosidase
MDEYKDVESKNYYQLVKRRSANDPQSLRDAQAALQHLSRDQSRLPMQWNESKNAGFSTGTPWMRVHDNYKKVNADREDRDSDSLLNFWKRVLAIRKNIQVFSYMGRLASTTRRINRHLRLLSNTGARLLWLF